MRLTRPAIRWQLAIDVEERPACFAGLLSDLHRLRVETGRPHWLVLDEAHHLLPTDWQPAEATVPVDLPATTLLTTHPKGLASALLATVTLDEFCARMGTPARAL
jgi:hypothetical protein